MEKKTCLLIAIFVPLIFIDLNTLFFIIILNREKNDKCTNLIIIVFLTINTFYFARKTGKVRSNLLKFANLRGNAHIKQKQSLCYSFFPLTQPELS